MRNKGTRRGIGRTVLLALAAACLVTVAPGASGSTPSQSRAVAPGASRLDPSLFAELASGVALVRDYNCAGKPTSQGTGFLVGTSVLMTARHVIRDACHVKVYIDNHWVGIRNMTSWYTPGRGDGNTADVTTIKLNQDSSGHVFTIRTSSAAVGKNLAALGHPLGNRISLNQGKVVEKGHLGTVPMLAVRMLAAEGGSGSPLVDDRGNVLGILQIGLGRKDVIGQRTSGVILGIDLPSWWPSVRKNLCHLYRYGGIANCGNTQTGPAPTPPTTTTPPGTTTTPTPPPPPPPPAAADGTRAHPWPLGSYASDSTWQIQVNSVNFDAWPVIAAANMFNHPPPAGYADVLANLTVTYKGSGSTSLSFGLDIDLGTVGASNVVFRSYTQSCGVPPDPTELDFTTILQGAVVTYNQCWQVPVSDVSTLQLYYDRWNNGFFALR